MNEPQNPAPTLSIDDPLEQAVPVSPAEAAAVTAAEQGLVEPGVAAEETAPAESAAAAELTTCPQCGSAINAEALFCEACGFKRRQGEPAAPDGSETPVTISAQTERPQPEVDEHEATVVIRRVCAECGGQVGSDGYCQTCGAKPPSERDHFTERPAPWVAGCCDRGVRHHRNEDAMALAARGPQGSRAVLVVCDGVSTSTDSDIASLAAARAAREVLVAHSPVGLGTSQSQIAAVSSALTTAVAAANQAIIDSTDGTGPSSASCTFSAAVIDKDLVVYGNIGDSRTYWLPDVGTADQPRQLSIDDSVAQVRMAAGVSREEAEAGPQAHAITRWLGRDAPDLQPGTGALKLAAPGWLLVCSDGLWNYASEAVALQELVARFDTEARDPLPLSKALVVWACEQGGRDNITASLARFDPAVIA